MSELDTRIRRANAKRAWGRALPTRWNFPADGVSRVACPCPSYLAPRQDAPGITLSSFKLKNPKTRCLGTMPKSLTAPGLDMRSCQSGLTSTPRNVAKRGGSRFDGHNSAGSSTCEPKSPSDDPSPARPGLEIAESLGSLMFPAMPRRDKTLMVR